MKIKDLDHTSILSKNKAIKRLKQKSDHIL